MANKKDIGHAYKEQLETYKVSPHNRVWDQIEGKLDKKENKRIAAYWKFSAGALLLLLLLSSTFYFYQNIDTKQSNEHSIESVNVEYSSSNSKDNNSLKEKPNTNQVISNNSITNASTDIINEAIRPKNYNYSQSINNSKKTSIDNNTYDSEKDQINELNSFSFIDILPLTYSSLIDISKIEKDSKKKKHKNSSKFHIKVTAGANHFGSLKKGSSIDETLKNKSIKSEITSNFGVALAYDLSKQSSISFGVQYTKLSNTTKAADSTNFDSTLKYSPGYQNINLYNSTNSYAALGSLSEIDLKQQLTYLEFPLQYYYTPSKSDLQLTFFGGLSFLALIDNDITAESSNGNALKIGTANNLSKVSLSLNIGSGLNYVISDKLKLHLEPTFKYYINTYNRNNNATPYSINLNLGMSYKF